MNSIFVWNCAQKVMRRMQLADLLQQRCAILEAGDIVWVDLENSTEEEDRAIFGEFWPIHSLSFEDVTKLRRDPEGHPHFPKVEEFADYLFVIVNPLTGEFMKSIQDIENDKAVERPYTQLSAVLTHNLLLTHHLDPLQCVNDVRGFLERHTSMAERGPDYIFHLLLDNTVDQYAPVLDYLEDHLDELEIEVIGRPRPAHFGQLLHFKRRIIALRKTLIHERELLVRLARGEFSLVDERETVYYRNVYDHLVRFSELIEASREMISDLMQSYLASMSNHLNQIMKVLTMISTIVLPMTLIAGIYGMNFKNLPELDWSFGYPFALALMLVSGLGSLSFFYWRRWL